MPSALIKKAHFTFLSVVKYFGCIEYSFATKRMRGISYGAISIVIWTRKFNLISHPLSKSWGVLFKVPCWIWSLTLVCAFFLPPKQQHQFPFLKKSLTFSFGRLKNYFFPIVAFPDFLRVMQIWTNVRLIWIGIRSVEIEISRKPYISVASIFQFAFKRLLSDVMHICFGYLVIEKQNSCYKLFIQDFLLLNFLSFSIENVLKFSFCWNFLLIFFEHLISTSI